MQILRIVLILFVASVLIGTPDGALAQASSAVPTEAISSDRALTQQATAYPSAVGLSPAVSPLSVPAHAARMTLDELKARLVQQGRTLSQATHEELALLATSDGSLLQNITNSEYVMRIGLSTFIIDLRIIASVIALASLLVLLFFTPLGFVLGRGRLHAVVGTILAGTRIAPDLGRHLIDEPARWLRHQPRPRRAFGLYMHNAFIPEYRNNITAVAFVGTAFLILNIGLRGIKFMTAHQPDMIIIAIIVEITVLCLLGMTTWYEKQMDVAEARSVVPAAEPIDVGMWIRRDDAIRMIDQVKQDIEASWREESARRMHASATP